MPSTVADRVREVLRLRGWSQRELSRKAGLSPGAIGWLLSHPNRPTETGTLQGIATAASVSMAWLLTGEGSPDHDDDARAPSTTDDATPIMANVPGWEDTVKVDRAEHEDITDVEVSNGERIAAYMLHRPAELVANVNGITVIEEPHCAQCGLEGTIPGGVFIRATTDAQRRALRILHELAHALLRKRRKGTYTHADVWGLTLMLAIPQRALRHADLCREIPKWARALRRTIARHAERMAA